MKKTHFAALFVLITVFSACQGDDPPTPPTTSASYMNVKAGSTWNYEQINNTPPIATTQYTLTSTNRDSTVDGESFHVFTNSSTSASEYYRISGSDYYTYQSLPAAVGGAKVKNLYLKAGAAIGTSWPQTYNITFSGLPVSVTVTHRIEERGLTKTVNSITYTDVIHVKTDIAVGGVPASALTSDIHTYYAPNAGIIENTNKINLNYFGIISNTDITTRLKTAVLL
jgi:hypothetical protein